MIQIILKGLAKTQENGVGPIRETVSELEPQPASSREIGPKAQTDIVEGGPARLLDQRAMLRRKQGKAFALSKPLENDSSEPSERLALKHDLQATYRNSQAIAFFSPRRTLPVACPV